MSSYGECPVCNGSKRMPCPDAFRKYGQKNGWYGYDAKDDTVDCNNCGAQYMNGRPTGRVLCRLDGEPCKHEYSSKPGPWRCTTSYTCKHCKEVYMIDSGD